MNNARDARFYFANLGADVARCVSAALENNDDKFDDSLRHARRTLAFLRKANRPEAYEEGLLLVRALIHARERDTLESFNVQLHSLIAQYSPMIR